VQKKEEAPELLYLSFSDGKLRTANVFVILEMHARQSSFPHRKSALFLFPVNSELANGKRLRNRRRASGTGHAHRLSIRSTPEIRYGSNGFRALTCVEVPLRAQL
jgi:hypothetical protein